jgi:hypothetical protein
MWARQSVKLLQELHSDTGYVETGVMEKGRFLYMQTRVIHPDDMVQVPCCCIVTVCTQYCPMDMDMELKKENVMSVPKFRHNFPPYPDFLGCTITA